MRIRIHFYSYCKELAGADSVDQEMPPGSRLGELRQAVLQRFPKLEPLQKSLLMAVGVDYQDGAWLLREGDEVSFFPPVQGG